MKNTKQESDKIQASIEIRKSRKKICHDEYYLAYYKNWTPAWLKSATTLLYDSPTYKRRYNSKENR